VGKQGKISWDRGSVVAVRGKDEWTIPGWAGIIVIHLESVAEYRLTAVAPPRVAPALRHLLLISS
jgi:hypothetical protein